MQHATQHVCSVAVRSSARSSSGIPAVRSVFSDADRRLRLFSFYVYVHWNILNKNHCWEFILGHLQEPSTVICCLCTCPSAWYPTYLGSLPIIKQMQIDRSLQKVQGHRTAGPESTWTWLHPQASLWDIPQSGDPVWPQCAGKYIVTLRVICKILRHRPCHNFLPGVLCIAQGHRITSYGSWHAYEKKKTGLPTGMSHRTACGWSQVHIGSLYLSLTPKFKT